MQHHQVINKQLKIERKRQLEQEFREAHPGEEVPDICKYISVYHIRRQNKLLSHPFANPIDKTNKSPVVYAGDVPKEFRGRTGAYRKKLVNDIREIKAFGNVLIEAHRKKGQNNDR
jgi:hypothetical protein